ncbi:MAG: hypothetical protein AB3N13_01645 [Arenibacterium sp.]
MDEFQFKSPRALVSIEEIPGESQIEILNFNVSPNAIWGTNGTAIVVEPQSFDMEPVVTFEDPLFG